MSEHHAGCNIREGLSDVCSCEIEAPCPGCGDGDKVPHAGYWRCPVCDAEWDDAGEESEPFSRSNPFGEQ